MPKTVESAPIRKKIELDRLHLVGQFYRGECAITKPFNEEELYMEQWA